MEDGGEDMELKYELWKESIFQEKVIYECRKRLSGYRRAVFCVMGNSLHRLTRAHSPLSCAMDK